MSTPLPANGQLTPAVLRIVVAYAQRGMTLQLVLRGVLALFVVGTLILLPPSVGGPACAVIAAGYVLAVAVLTEWLRRGGRAAIAWGWLGLYVDLLVLSALCVITGRTAAADWTSYVLLGGFFLLPVLAATQLRWGVCASVVVPTVAFYGIEAIATQQANSEPWASIILRILVIAGVGAAAIGLTRIQRARLLAIEGLVSDRTQLLTELMTVTDSERRALAENLHDGALQYILAARMDLEDARDLADPTAFDRLDQALTQSSRLLRSTVSRAASGGSAAVGAGRRRSATGPHRGRAGRPRADPGHRRLAGAGPHPGGPAAVQHGPGVAGQRGPARGSPPAEPGTRAARRGRQRW